MCILSIFLYGSECWAVTSDDAQKIETLDQWCLRRLLGIKWYQFVSNAEVQLTTSQSLLTSVIQFRGLSICGRIAQMDGNIDAKKILIAFPMEGWKRPSGRPRIAWFKTTE